MEYQREVSSLYFEGSAFRGEGLVGWYCWGARKKDKAIHPFIAEVLSKKKSSKLTSIFCWGIFLTPQIWNFFGKMWVSHIFWIVLLVNEIIKFNGTLGFVERIKEDLEWNWNTSKEWMLTWKKTFLLNQKILNWKKIFCNIKKCSTEKILFWEASHIRDALLSKG